MSFDAAATFAAAMFTILNPIGNTTLFAGLVADRSRSQRRTIAITCTIAIAVILIVSLWVGEQILAFFGVTIPSLETAGGLIIALIGMSMLRSHQSSIHSTGEQQAGSAPPAVDCRGASGYADGRRPRGHRHRRVARPSLSL